MTLEDTIKSALDTINYQSSVIVEQNQHIQNLEDDVKRFKGQLEHVYELLFCIGGPLNDNFHQYNKEQLKIFFEIKRAIEECDE